MRLLANLPKAKWSSVNAEEPLIEQDLIDLEKSALESFEIPVPPCLNWVDNTAVKVPATADSPAGVMLSGFPDVLHPGQLLPDGAGLSDGKYRENTGDATMDFDLATCLWGTEKASQWYTIYALAAGSDTSFTLKAMPYMRVKSQASQVISLGTNLTPATGIGYGFTTDQFADGSKIYVLTGASKGLLRTILHNNNDSGTGGTIEYSGAALSLAAGDYFIILPATNFRRLGDVYNNSSSDFLWVDDFIFGKFPYVFTVTPADPWFCPVTVNKILETGCGAGAASTIFEIVPGSFISIWGNSGQMDIKYPLTPSPGTPYPVTIGTTGTTSLGSLRSLAAGAGIPGSSIGPYGIGGYGGTYGPGTPGGTGFLMIERAQ